MDGRLMLSLCNFQAGSDKFLLYQMQKHFKEMRKFYPSFEEDQIDFYCMIIRKKETF